MVPLVGILGCLVRAPGGGLTVWREKGQADVESWGGSTAPTEEVVTHLCGPDVGVSISLALASSFQTLHSPSLTAGKV